MVGDILEVIQFVLHNCQFLMSTALHSGCVVLNFRERKLHFNCYSYILLFVDDSRNGSICSFALWMFPDISTLDNGIEIKVFFFTIHIEWKNIIRMEKRKNRLLIFLRTKGLLLNRLYGLFDAKVWDQPVVLFVSNVEMVDTLEEDIKTHLARLG